MPMQTGAQLTVDGLAGVLREAYQRVAHLPRARRREVIEYCLAYHLGQAGESAGRDWLVPLLARFENLEVLAVEVPAISQRSTEEVLINLLDRYYGEQRAGASDGAALVEHADEALESLAGTLARISKARGWRTTSLRDQLVLIENLLTASDGAMKQAAAESFERLLQALNPEVIKGAHPGTLIKFGPFFKASLYEAMSEKFTQLDDYRRQDRLVRDFLAMYNKHLKLKLAESVIK